MFNQLGKLWSGAPLGRYDQFTYKTISQSLVWMKWKQYEGKKDKDNMLLLISFTIWIP
jgi:hypothetical protein